MHTTLQEDGIDQSGAWRGKSFHHATDNNFGKALITLLKDQKISSVTDLGCGTGDYVKRIAGSAISVQGFDGNPKTAELDVSGGLCVGPVDLTKERTWKMTDAAMSFEVAEHIPAQFEDKFVDNLVSSARDLVILSWAVPGQGGEGHVNGKTAVAVNQKMKERGWEKNKGFTSKLQSSATLPWIRANVQVFIKEEGRIDQNGAWRGKSFHHVTDDNFGKALITLLKDQKISSVTDLGCGTGDYVKRIAGSAISVQGFDGNPKTTELDVSGGLCVGPVDLTKKRTWNMTDAAMSIEVAEHIPAQFEDNFMDNLVSSARDLVILSWAVPGQRGEGHVNGKTAVAVNQNMKERGWEKNEGFTSQLQSSATLPWIRANVQVYTKRSFHEEITLQLP